MDEELHLNQFEVNISTRGTQQDLVNLLDICLSERFYEGWILRKAIFHFLKPREGEARIMEHFQMR